MPRKKTPKLFLSHSHVDRGIVLRVATELERSGIPIWLDRWELQAGDSIIDKINEGIGNTDYLAVFLSPASLKSEWVRKEMNAGLMKELNRKSVSLLIVLLPKCDPQNVPPLIQDKVRIDFRTSYLTGLSDFLEVFRKTKKAAELLFAEATHLLQNGIVDEAIPILQDALEKYPAHFDAMHNLGVAYQMKGMDDDALTLFKTLVHEQPNIAIYKNGLGVTLLNKGFAERGLDQLREAIRIAPDNDEVRFSAGLQFERMGLHRESAEQYEEMLRHNPEHTRAWFGLGTALLGLGENERAIEIHRKIVASEPNWADAFNNLGTALARSGNLVEACQNWEKAVLLDPRKPDAHRNLAQSYFELGRTSESLTYFRTLLHIDPSNVNDQLAFARAFQYLGRKDDAIREYYKVLELDRNNTDARAELAMALRNRPAMEQAVSELSKAKLQDANHVSVKMAQHFFALMDMADGIVQTGVTAHDEFGDDILDALHVISPLRERAVELLQSESLDEESIAKLIQDLDSAESANLALECMRHDVLGAIALRQNDTKEAIGHFRKSVELRPFGKWTHVNLAMAYYNDGQFGRAIEEWEHALEIDPSDCLLMLRVAIAYDTHGLVTQAIHWYEQFSKLCPDHEEASSVKELLDNLRSAS